MPITGGKFPLILTRISVTQSNTLEILEEVGGGL